MRSKQIVGAAAALALASWCASVTVALADPTGPAPGPAPGPPPAPATSGAPAPAAGPVSTFEGDGSYAVGTQIVPGTYSSAGPIEGGACYWKRVSGDKLVDNALSKKAQVVKIEASDTTFKTSDCQTWQKIDDCLPGCGPQGANPGEMLGQLGRLVLGNPGAPPAGPPPAGAPPAG